MDFGTDPPEPALIAEVETRPILPPPPTREASDSPTAPRQPDREVDPTQAWRRTSPGDLRVARHRKGHKVSRQDVDNADVQRKGSRLLEGEGKQGCPRARRLGSLRSEGREG